MRWKSSSASAPAETVALTLLHFLQKQKDSEALLPSLQEDQHTTCLWDFSWKGSWKGSKWRGRIDMTDVSLRMTLVTAYSDKVLKSKEELDKQAPSWERNGSSMSCIKGCTQFNFFCWHCGNWNEFKALLCCILHGSTEPGSPETSAVFCSV